MCPKGQPIDTGYPAHTQFSFFAKRIIFQNNGSFFLSEAVSVYPCRVPLKVVSSSTGPVYGAHPTPASASGRHKPRTLCNETWQHVPQNTQKLRVLKRGAKRVNICVSVRKKKHPLRVRVMQTDAHRVNHRHGRRFFANAILLDKLNKSYVKHCPRSEL